MYQCNAETPCIAQEVGQFQRQLESLPNERECRQEEERLTAELQGLEKNLSYKEMDLKATLDKQQKYDSEVCRNISELS